LKYVSKKLTFRSNFVTKFGTCLYFLSSNFVNELTFLSKRTAKIRTFLKPAKYFAKLIAKKPIIFPYLCY